MSASLAARIALGTVQFGLPYGVANHAGQVTAEDARAILARARAAGMETLDTAIAYGTSEERLGRIGVSSWRVVTKIPRIPEGCGDVRAWVGAMVDGSLQRLGLQRLDAVLLHHPADLLGRHGPELHAALLGARARGATKRIGVSIYEPGELDPLVPQFELDLVQTPFNVFDRRIVASGWLERLGAAGIALHVRSVFLQGLLLMPPESRPETFAPWQETLRAWDHWLAESNVTAVHAALALALAQQGFERIVVGVDSLKQLDEILGELAKPLTCPPPSLASDDPDLLNPARWKRS